MTFMYERVACPWRRLAAATAAISRVFNLLVRPEQIGTRKRADGRTANLCKLVVASEVANRRRSLLCRRL